MARNAMYASENAQGYSKAKTVGWDLGYPWQQRACSSDWPRDPVLHRYAVDRHRMKVLTFARMDVILRALQTSQN